MIENSNNIVTPLIYGEFDTDTILFNNAADKALLSTQPTGISGDAIATVEFVTKGVVSYTEFVTAGIPTATDYQVECTGSTDYTVTLPTAVGIQGKVYSIKNTGTGIITIDGNGSETIGGELTQSISQWDNMTIMSDNENWIII